MNLMQTQMTAPTAGVHTTLDTVAYAIGESAIGKILAARSAIGVCAILIGSDADTLERDLGNRFPGKMLVEDKATLRDDLAAIARFIETPGAGLDLPLDMRRRRSAACVGRVRTIPCGAIITYAALARRLGQPNGARAVATACAANAIALGIPCHRVVRADGTLAGYRRGVERKRALLDKEATL